MTSTHPSGARPVVHQTRWQAARVLLAAALATAAVAAHADLQDEIQVYDNAINKPGEFGLELHVNTTPVGRYAPDYPGEVAPRHGVRVTPEFSWGLTPSTEVGLYVPTLRRPDGQLDVAGAKVRLKWLPFQVDGDTGYFGGVNLELSRLARPFSASRTSLESRFIAGWRNPDWLLAINPTLGFSLSDGYRGQRPDLQFGVKATRRVQEGLAAGLEYYNGLGALGRSLPWQQQDNRVFAVLDVDMAPWVFNVGLGYGLTHSSDRWTLKAIFEVPISTARPG